MFIHPRSVIGTPQPPPSRPKLRHVGILLAHHVGFTATTRYRSADPTRVLDDARAAAGYGISSGRPWEYGHMIGLDGSIFEQGGEYRQAHCLNFNPASDSVIFLNADGDVECTPAQIEAWHWLRAHQVARGVLTADHEAAPHYRYRDTSCPGDARAQPPGGPWDSPTGEGRMGNLIPALLNPPTPPQPLPEDDDMAAYIAIPPPERKGKEWLFVSSSVRPATTFDVEDGVPKRDMASIPVEYRVGQYDALAKSAGL